MPDTSYSGRPWRHSAPPGKILAIRLQALGDVVITFPYLNDLKRQFPNCELHFLTLHENAGIPASLVFIDRVISIRGGRTVWKQLAYLLAMVPRLVAQKYDVVLDLQNHWYSRKLVRLLGPKAWCYFDRASPVSAGERNRRALEGVFGCRVQLNSAFRLRNSPENLIRQIPGLSEGRPMVVINPAGLFATRQWPLENYATLIDLIVKALPGAVVVMIGLKERLAQAEEFFHRHASGVLSMAGKTAPAEAFALVGQASLVVSEDSGLMHMAWVQNVPTVALLGSTRSDWAAPQGSRSFCFHSSDLPCGNCMRPICLHGDNRCLTRVGPEAVLTACLDVMSRK